MPHGVHGASDLPGLASLHRGFAMALSHEKFDSAGKAGKALQIRKSGKAKKEIIDAQFSAWREGCGSAIRKFFPQYIELGLAYPDRVTSDVVEWAHEQAWVPLCGQCGVQKYGERHPHRSLSVRWWLAVALDGDFGVNTPDHAPWCAPKWLAASPRETDKLIVDWSHSLSARFAGVLDEAMEVARVKVAIAAAPLEYRRLTPEQLSGVGTTPTWAELAEKFQPIHAKAPGQTFSATFMPPEDKSGSLCGDWILGANPDCRMDFEIVASIAARKLGCTSSEGAREYWLNCVREWMQQNGLDKDKRVAFLDTTGILRIDKIAMESARFCTYLMARGTPESAIAPSKTESSPRPGIAIVPANRPNRSTRKAKMPTLHESKRRGIIQGATQANDKGLKYCKTVDERKLAIPADWLQGGCPKTYTEAYRVGQPWRKRIQDEKYRNRKK